MKLDVVNNTKKGIRIGFIYKTISLLMPFILQTVTVKTLGLEYVGVKGLYTSILTILSLSELGFGSAIIFSMYKPIADDDYSVIEALLNFFKKVYFFIGLIIFILGIIIIPFVGYLINGDCPDGLNVNLVFLLYLLNTTFSYWFYAYKSSLLTAYQRVDVMSCVGIIIQVFAGIIQIFILIFTYNFYLFLSVSIVFTIINNCLISKLVDRMYPQISPRGKLSNDILSVIKKNIKSIFISKVCGTTRNTFDNIFITKFIGLEMAAIYSNYYFIIFSLTSISEMALSSMLSGIGNQIIIYKKEENYKNMMILQTIYMLISGWASVCMLCLYQPFMRLWIGNNGLFPEYIMFLFPLYFLIGKMGDVRGVYSDAVGLFRENRTRTILEAIFNVFLNLFLVIKFGVFGILIATIVTLFVFGFLCSAIIAFKHYFVFGLKNYLINTLYYSLITVFIGTISYVILNTISFSDNYFDFLARCLFCLLFVPILFLCLSFYRKDYKDAIIWIKRYLFNKSAYL